MYTLQNIYKSRIIPIRHAFFLVMVLNVLSATGQQNEIYLIEAEKALKNTDTVRAIAYFESILDHDPQYFPAALRLAEIHYKGKNWSKAALYANISLDILSDKEIALTKTNYSQNISDTAIVLEDYAKYQKLKSDIASVLHLRAKTRMKQENYYSAVADLDSAYGYAPFNAELQVDYGLALAKMGDYPNAFSRFFLALDIDPENFKAHHNIGLLWLAHHDTIKALEYLEKSISLNDTLSPAMIEVSRIYMNQGQFKKAISMYSRIIAINSRSIEAFFRRGFAYNKLGKKTKALADWETAFSLDSTQIEAVRNAGIIRLGLKDYPAAISDFTTYIDRLPDQSVGYLNRGYAYILNQEYDKAVPDLKKSIEIDPKDDSGYYYLSLAYAHSDDRKNACKFLRQAIEHGFDKERAEAIILKMCD